MSDVTREEMNARLEAVEARMETRLISMDAKLDILLNRIEAVATTANEAKEEARNARNAASGLVWNFAFVAFAAIAIQIAVYAAIWQVASVLHH